jgi:SDR family mycofactocin-dependent oxidoreductase
MGATWQRGGVSERVVWITGAARGIGAATASAFAAAGWSVVLSDICAPIEGISHPVATQDDLAASAAAASATAAGAAGAAIVEAVADVRSTDALASVVEMIVERFGGLDAVVAAAGVIAGGAPTWQLDPNEWQAGLDVNLTGVWNTVRAAVPALLARAEPRSGRIVTVASAAALRALAGIGGYGAAKAGVVALTQALALEIAPLGVTANVVAPGSTRTGLLDASAALYGLDDPDEFAGHHPIGRLIDPTEVAAAILWLCDPARGGITGAVLPVDGGMTR